MGKLMQCDPDTGWRWALPEVSADGRGEEVMSDER